MQPYSPHASIDLSTDTASLNSPSSLPPPRRAIQTRTKASIAFPLSEDLIWRLVKSELVPMEAKINSLKGWLIDLEGRDTKLAKTVASALSMIMRAAN